MNFFRTWIIPSGLALLSVGLQLLSSTPFADNIMGAFFKPESIGKAKGIINIICYIFFVAPISIQAVSRGIKANKAVILFQNCWKQERDILFHLLTKKNYIDCSKDDISIRIFKKKRKKLVLQKQFENPDQQIKDRLAFSIDKNQGLCVQAYEKGCSLLETGDASRKEYNLNKQQSTLVGDLKFVAAVPIFTPEGEKSKFVICFDSFQEIANSGDAQGILKECETVAYDIASLIR